MGFSFYDWCIENNRSDLLDRWNYELNHCSPRDVKYRSGKDMYFNCMNNNHHVPEKFRIDHITLNTVKATCRQCNSFYQWCLDNGEQELIDTWDYNLNVDDIHFVAYASGKRCFFKILDKYPSISYRLSDITSSKHLSPIKKFYNSFGYYLIHTYGEDAIAKYWSDKNNKTPWNYDKGSGKKVWFKCPDKNYHDDYLTEIYSFTMGSRCPWCAGKKVHPKDSFAQYNIDKFGMDFLEKYWHKENIIDPWTIRPFANNIKVIIQCQHKTYHQYDVVASDFSTGIDCPYCNKKRLHILDSFGMRFPEVFEIWSDKNAQTPFEYRVASHEKVWFKCKDGKHEDYSRRISDYSYKHFTRCPYCVQECGESSFQNQVRVFLNELPYQILHEYNCTIIPINSKTNRKMPFDNEVCNINGINLIIEVHGIQHYELCGWHITQAKNSGRTPVEEFEYQKWKDNFKKNYAIAHQYEYLEIPYYRIIDDTYKDLIMSKINLINNIILQETLETAGGMW